MKPPVRIGIIDSGVFLNHPHVGGVVAGVTIQADACTPEFSDLLGHGTAITALIHALAPEAELTAVRVFDRSLSTSIRRVERAIDWCLENRMQIINLSLGTMNHDHRSVFATATERVHRAGAALVSAFEINGQLMLPGCLPGVIGVTTDASCPHEKYVCEERDGRKVFRASPYPLEIPGVPREHNLNGVSFAVAHISAHLARLWPGDGYISDWEQLLANSADILASV